MVARKLEAGGPARATHYPARGAADRPAETWSRRGRGRRSRSDGLPDRVVEPAHAPLIDGTASWPRNAELRALRLASRSRLPDRTCAPRCASGAPTRAPTMAENCQFAGSFESRWGHSFRDTTRASAVGSATHHLAHAHPRAHRAAADRLGGARAALLTWVTSRSPRCGRRGRGSWPFAGPKACPSGRSTAALRVWPALRTWRRRHRPRG